MLGIKNAAKVLRLLKLTLLNVCNALTEDRRACTMICTILVKFKLLSACWHSRTKLKQIYI